jgi:hypothetical protein
LVLIDGADAICAEEQPSAWESWNHSAQAETETGRIIKRRRWLQAFAQEQPPVKAALRGGNKVFMDWRVTSLGTFGECRRQTRLVATGWVMAPFLRGVLLKVVYAQGQTAGNFCPERALDALRRRVLFRGRFSSQRSRPGCGCPLPAEYASESVAIVLKTAD